VHQSPCFGAGLLWRSLGRSLRGNFNACAARQAGGWVGAAASRRVLTPSIYNKKRTVFNKPVRPHSACAMLKTTPNGACAEPLPINA